MTEMFAGTFYWVAFTNTVDLSDGAAPGQQGASQQIPHR